MTRAIATLDSTQTMMEGISLRGIAVKSLLIILIGFGGLTGWAAFSEIESAVPATGVVVTAGKRKTLSLAENGILQALKVREGDAVGAGQVLLQLDDVQIRTAYAQANVIYWSAKARAARLEAEAIDSREMKISEGLKKATEDPAIKAAMEAEQHQFLMRWQSLDNSLTINQRRIAQQEALISALKAQIKSSGLRLGLITEEMKDANYLIQRGLATKPHVLKLQSQEAEIKGQIGQLGGQLAEATHTIAQIEQENLGLKHTRRTEISKEQSENQAVLADAEQKMIASQDLLQKREVRSPEEGTVTDIRFFTPGSSIMAGQPIMDIVPNNTRMLIEGTVTPNEVRHLAIGQPVNIRLTAYKAHSVPVLTGHLVYVGADRQMDAQNRPVFMVRAEIDQNALKDKPSITLYPGMGADVLIINGKRSVLDFLISPISDNIRSGMKEE